MRAYVQSRVPRWVPFIWLAYLTFFLWQPITQHASRTEWIATAAALVVFLFFYFAFFVTRRPWPLICVVCIGAIGVVYAPFNGGAANFFIYAASMAPFALDTEWAGALAIAGVVTVAALESWLLHITNGFIFPATFLSTFIGAANIYFAQKNRHVEELKRANAEIEQLTKVAERERIARDLHDVLGHTLSLITLKSELANRLFERDPVSARREIAEVERVAREALTQVRRAVTGIRAAGLAAEMASAKLLLESNGVRLDYDFADVPLPVEIETVLAMTVREAATNIQRHARANSARVTLEVQGAGLVLCVEDDGRGGAIVPGNGLSGMRERLAGIGAELRVDSGKGRGTVVRVTLPLPEPTATSTGAQLQQA